MPETAQLILGQSFGGKEINGTAVFIMHKRVESGQVIAQGLATGTRRGYYHILPGEDGVQRFCLVAVKAGYAQRLQTCLKAWMDGVVECLEDRALVRNPFNVDNLLAVIGQAEKVVQKYSGIHLRRS